MHKELELDTREKRLARQEIRHPLGRRRQHCAKFELRYSERAFKAMTRRRVRTQRHERHILNRRLTGILCGHQIGDSQHASITVGRGFVSATRQRKKRPAQAGEAAHHQFSEAFPGDHLPLQTLHLFMLAHLILNRVNTGQRRLLDALGSTP